MIDSPFPESYDYCSRGPYTTVVIRKDGTGIVKRKRRLLKAGIAMFRHVPTDEVRLWQIIDSAGYVLFHCREGGVMLGCREAFDTLAEMAGILGNDWMLENLIDLELESRLMWPAT